MDGKIELPEHIAIGQYIKIAEWVGRIDDILTGQTMTVLKVTSPKIAGNYELIEYVPGQHESLIRPADELAWLENCKRYIIAAQYRIENIKKLMG